MAVVPLLDLKAQYASIRTEIAEAIQRVLQSQQFILGPEVEAFEQELAAFCNARFAVGVSSGTDALLVALMVIDTQPGDEIITTAYSFFATAGVIARLGARPVFVDIDPVTFNLNSAEVQKKINPRTKAIIPVHLFGQCAMMDPIIEAAKAAGVHVVEDAAQAIGARDEQGRQAGTVGKIGCFSFFPSKNLGAFGDAGMVVTNDPDLAERIRIIRVHGGKPKYEHRVIGGNFRLDALQAAVLRVKLRHLTKWTEMRRQNADRYRSLSGEMGLSKDISLPRDSAGHTYHQFVIRLAQREGLRMFLTEHGVETEVYYPIPLHLQQCFAHLKHRDGDLPYAEAAARTCLALPIYPEIAAEQQRYVIQQIAEFCH